MPANDYGMDVSQLKNLVVRPALAALQLNSESAVNLLTGTALAESRAKFVKQIGGPALGLWQMEPATHDDCFANFLNFPAQSKFATALHQMLAADSAPVDQLVNNLRYACAMARIRFYRSPLPLPSATDPIAMSAYHKRVYNTPKGAADPQANVVHFKAAIAA